MPLIRVADVHVDYPVHRGPVKKVLAGVNLLIHAGEFISVVGQTGCGKSTLLRLILGAEIPTSGQVLIDGQVRNHPDRDRGYVPQKYSLFPDKTVLDNVTFGLEVGEFGLLGWLSPRYHRRKKEFQAKAYEYLRHMGLAESDGKKYPDQLSGGMQQRVAIAQALITSPRILLMDEAFSALDPGTRRDMQKLIRKIWSELGTTIVFVTHNMHEAVYLGTRVVMLAKTDPAGGARVAREIPVSQVEDHGEIQEVIRDIEDGAMIEA
jgi:NitT/TauT family transport system ATP-binding protein